MHRFIVPERPKRLEMIAEGIWKHLDDVWNGKAGQNRSELVIGINQLIDVEQSTKV